MCKHDLSSISFSNYKQSYKHDVSKIEMSD